MTTYLHFGQPPEHFVAREFAEPAVVIIARPVGRFDAAAGAALDEALRAEAREPERAVLYGAVGAIPSDVTEEVPR